MQSTNVTEKFRAIRATNPRLRRAEPVAIIHSGSRQTIFDCIFCGARHTAATTYRNALHVQRFRDHHNSGACCRDA